MKQREDGACGRRLRVRGRGEKKPALGSIAQRVTSPEQAPAARADQFLYGLRSGWSINREASACVPVETDGYVASCALAPSLPPTPLSRSRSSSLALSLSSARIHSRIFNINRSTCADFLTFQNCTSRHAFEMITFSKHGRFQTIINSGTMIDFEQ